MTEIKSCKNCKHRKGLTATFWQCNRIPERARFIGLSLFGVVMNVYRTETELPLKAEIEQLRRDKQILMEAKQCQRGEQ